MLTRKEFEVIYRHLMQDINYGAEGTFYKDSNYEKFDNKSAEIAKKALYKIEQEFSK